MFALSKAALLCVTVVICSAALCNASDASRIDATNQLLPGLLRIETCSACRRWESHAKLVQQKTLMPSSGRRSPLESLRKLASVWYFFGTVTSCVDKCVACRHVMRSMVWASAWVPREQWGNFVVDRCDVIGRTGQETSAGAMDKRECVSVALEFLRMDRGNLMCDAPSNFRDKRAVEKFVVSTCARTRCCSPVFTEDRAYIDDPKTGEQVEVQRLFSSSGGKSPQMPYLSEFFDKYAKDVKPLESEDAGSSSVRSYMCFQCKNVLGLFSSQLQSILASVPERSDGVHGALATACLTKRTDLVKAALEKDFRVKLAQTVNSCMAIVDELSRVFGKGRLLQLMVHLSSSYHWTASTYSYTEGPHMPMHEWPGADAFCGMTFCSDAEVGEGGMVADGRAVEIERTALSPEDYMAAVVRARSTAYPSRLFATRVFAKQVLRQVEKVRHMNRSIDRMYQMIPRDIGHRCETEKCFRKSYEAVGKAYRRAVYLVEKEREMDEVQAEYTEVINRLIGEGLEERNELECSGLRLADYVRENEDEQEKKRNSEKYKGRTANGQSFFVSAEEMSALEEYEREEIDYIRDHPLDQLYDYWNRAGEELGGMENVPLKAAMLGKMRRGELLEIGRGGTGAVFRTQFLGSDVVVKRFSAMVDHDFSVLKNEVAFAQMMSDQQSQRFIGYYGFFRFADTSSPMASDVFCMVYEYVDFSLAKLLDVWKEENSRPVPEKERFNQAKARGRVLRQVGSQLAEGVSVLQRIGYAHRDIKVDNVLMRDPYVNGILDETAIDIKIIDFDRAIPIAAAPDKAGTPDAERYPRVESSTHIMPPEALGVLMMSENDGQPRTRLEGMVEAVAASGEKGECMGIDSIQDIVAALLEDEVKKVGFFGSTDPKIAVREHAEKNMMSCQKNYGTEWEEPKFRRRMGDILAASSTLPIEEVCTGIMAMTFLVDRAGRPLLAGYDMWSVGITLLQLAAADRNVMYNLMRGEGHPEGCSGVCQRFDPNNEDIPVGCQFKASAAVFYGSGTPTALRDNIDALIIHNLYGPDPPHYISTLSVPVLGEDGLDFVLKLLQIDPLDRMAADVAHLHPFIASGVDSRSSSDPIPLSDQDIPGGIPPLSTCAGTCNGFWSKDNDVCMVQECFLCTSLVTAIGEMKREGTLGPHALKWWCSHRVFSDESAQNREIIPLCKNMANEVSNEENLPKFSSAIRIGFMEQLTTVAKKICANAGCCKKSQGGAACGAGSAPLEIMDHPNAEFRDVQDADVNSLLEEIFAEGLLDDDNEEGDEEEEDEEEEKESVVEDSRSISERSLSKGSRSFSDSDLDSMLSSDQMWSSRRDSFHEPIEGECTAKCSLCKYVVEYATTRALSHGVDLKSMVGPACRDYSSVEQRPFLSSDASSTFDYEACHKFGGRLMSLPWVETSIYMTGQRYESKKSAVETSSVGERMANVVCSQALCCNEKCDRQSHPTILDRVWKQDAPGVIRRGAYRDVLSNVMPFLRTHVLTMYERVRQQHRTTMDMVARLHSRYSRVTVLGRRRSFSWGDLFTYRAADERDVEAWMEMFRNELRKKPVYEDGRRLLHAALLERVQSVDADNKYAHLFKTNRSIAAAVSAVLQSRMQELREYGTKSLGLDLNTLTYNQYRGYTSRITRGDDWTLGSSSAPPRPKMRRRHTVGGDGLLGE